MRRQNGIGAGERASAILLVITRTHLQEVAASSLNDVAVFLDSPHRSAAGSAAEIERRGTSEVSTSNLPIEPDMVARERRTLQGVACTKKARRLLAFVCVRFFWRGASVCVRALLRCGRRGDTGRETVALGRLLRRTRPYHSFSLPLSLVPTDAVVEMWPVWSTMQRP